MRGATVVLPLSILLSTATPLAAQQAGAEERREGDPVEMLLNIQTALGLNVEQVAALRAIQERLVRKNRPLVDRLVELQREVRARFAGSNSADLVGEAALDLQVEIGRAPMRRIYENNVEAMEQVGEVLTRRQKRLAAELLDLPEVDRRWRPGRGRWPRRVRRKSEG